jgi:hypothetical protein
MKFEGNITVFALRYWGKSEKTRVAGYPTDISVEHKNTTVTLLGAFFPSSGYHVATIRRTAICALSLTLSYGKINRPMSIRRMSVNPPTTYYNS